MGWFQFIYCIACFNTSMFWFHCILAIFGDLQISTYILTLSRIFVAKIRPVFDQVQSYLLLSLWGGNLTSPDIMATLEELSRKRKEVGHSYKGDHILGHSDQGDPNLVI